MKVALIVSLVANAGLGVAAFFAYRQWLLVQIHLARLAEQNAVTHFKNGFQHAWQQIERQAKEAEDKLKSVA